MMKPVCVLCLLAVLVGCKEPAPITLLPGDNEAVEISSLAPGDTNVAYGAFDSSAVLPSDQLHFDGMFVLNKMMFDKGDRVDSILFTRVFVADRSRPIEILGHIIGYHGRDLGAVALNGFSLTRIPHLVRMRRLSRDSLAGFEYIRDVRTVYQPAGDFSWSASPPGGPNIAISIRSPEALQVLSPRGGALYSRNQNLELRWRGRGTLFIVLSVYEPASRHTTPIIRVRPLVNAGRAIIPTKVLRTLPSNRFFALSFVLLNRNEVTPGSGAFGEVLVQASDVHTTYIELVQ